MSDHPHADVVRRGFEAFINGDMATMDEISSEVWTVFDNQHEAAEFWS